MAVYWDSLFHLFRADQFCILYDYQKAHSLWELITDMYSYTRTRECNPGDPLMFRPVLHLLLAFESWFFGRTIVLWQLTGICFHLIATLIILSLLRLFLPKSISFILAAYFATQPSLAEAIIWQHINGYILFVVTILVALLYLKPEISMSKESGRNKIRIGLFLSLLIGSFTYELGVPLSLLFAIALFSISSRKSRSKIIEIALILSIPFIYYGINYIDYNFHGVLNRESISLKLGLIELKVAYYALNVFFFWFFTLRHAGFNMAGTRLQFPLYTQETAIFLFFLLVGIAMGVWIYNIKTRKQKELKNCGIFLIVLTAAMLGYIYTISIGRLIPRGFGQLSYNTYYAYLAFTFTLLVFAFAIKILISFKHAIPLITRRIFFALFLLVVSWEIVHNVQMVKGINVFVRDHYSGVRHLFVQVNDFIESKKASNPTINFCEQPKENLTLRWIQYSPERYEISKRQIDVAFAEYFSNDPKYWLTYKKGELSTDNKCPPKR